MEEEQNQDPEGYFLPPEIIQAKLALNLTKAYGNYHKVLDTLRNIYVSKGNIAEVQQIMRNVNAFLKFIDDSRKFVKEPHLEQGRCIDKVHKDFAAPFETVKNMVQTKLNIVARELEEEQRIEREKIVRKQQIADAINQFILDYSIRIASATNNEQLLGYERLINLEKANKVRYADQLPLLIERCNELNTMIKDQKKLIKEKEQIEAEKKKAIEAEDDEKLQELKLKEEQIEEKITENTILVQEEATNSMIRISQDEESEGVKARRTVWKAEIVDAKAVIKKASEMLDICLNTEKVRETINTLKAAGVFKGKTEYIMNGIRYYEAKTF